MFYKGLFADTRAKWLAKPGELGPKADASWAKHAIAKWNIKVIFSGINTASIKLPILRGAGNPEPDQRTDCRERPLNDQ